MTCAELKEKEVKEDQWIRKFTVTCAEVKEKEVEEY